MKEFEIFQLGQLQFINNAIYTLVVVLMTALAFYLIRRRNELNLPSYSKVVLSLFCTCIVFFGLQVGGFLYQTQRMMSYQLSELNASGVSISNTAQNWIDFVGHTFQDGVPSVSPDVPTIILWALIAFMFFGGIWFRMPDQK